jgi:hypothetical protein
MTYTPSKQAGRYQHTHQRATKLSHLAACTHLQRPPVKNKLGQMTCGTCFNALSPWEYDRATLHAYYLASLGSETRTLPPLEETPASA